MASDSDGDGTVADITVQVRRDLRDEIRSTNTRLDQTNARLDQTNTGLATLCEDMHTELATLRDEVHEGLAATSARLDGLQDETRRGFAALGARIDHLLGGEHGREHAELRERVVRLEERAGRHGSGGP